MALLVIETKFGNIGFSIPEIKIITVIKNAENYTIAIWMMPLKVMLGQDPKRPTSGGKYIMHTVL